MRPLELRLRNFRSFATGTDNEVVFDFRNRRLIGVVGPIGSGKSTILDAIAFALYGRTPRVNRATRSLVHQRSDAGAVALRFRVDDDIWEAVRSLRKKGQSQHALYRLPDDLPDVEPVEKIVLESEVNERIEQLLGFDYGAFSRSVMLAQGQFAEFLTAAPGQRDRVLKGVFGHERLDTMRGLAKDEIRTAEHELEKLEIRLGEAMRATERVVEDRVALAEAEGRKSVLDDRRGAVEELLARQSDIAERRRRAEADRTALVDRATQMPDPEQSRQLLDTASEAAAQRARLATEVEAAHEALAAAEQQIRSDDHLARSTAVTSAEKLRTEYESRLREQHQADAQRAAAAKRVAEAQATSAEAHAALEEATEAAGLAAADLATADETLAAATDALHAARHADMAMTLRTDLVHGDPCPVCEQTVAEIPDGTAVGDLDDVERSVAAATEARRASERVHVAAQGALAAAAQADEGARQRAAEFSAHLEAAESAATEAAGTMVTLAEDLAELVGAGDAAERIATLRADLDAERAAVEQARDRLDDRRRAQESAIAGEQETQRALGDLRSRIGAMARQIDPDAEVPSDDPQELRVALDDVRAAWATAQTALTEAIEAAIRDAAAADAAVAELREELGITDTFEATLARVEAELEMRRARIEADEAVIEASEVLRAADAAQRVELDHLRRLAGDLTDSRFIRYLLDEERIQLAELGSDHFQRLSSGRYRFSDGGDLEVVDLTSADAVRKADSLSGGETFLASLALALGLAEMVSRTGGRLEAFFLDEGFGSLDAEHLDLAMEGIERLVGDGGDRLVVVVSHVTELKERLEDLIVLDRDATTGDSRVVQG